METLSVSAFFFHTLRLLRPAAAKPPALTLGRVYITFHYFTYGWVLSKISPGRLHTFSFATVAIVAYHTPALPSSLQYSTCWVVIPTDRFLVYELQMCRGANARLIITPFCQRGISTPPFTGVSMKRLFLFLSETTAIPYVSIDRQCFDEALLLLHAQVAQQGGYPHLSNGL